MPVVLREPGRRYRHCTQSGTLPGYVWLPSTSKRAVAMIISVSSGQEASRHGDTAEVNSLLIVVVVSQVVRDSVSPISPSSIMVVRIIDMHASLPIHECDGY